MNKPFRTFGSRCAAAGASLAAMLLIAQAGLSQDQKEPSVPAAGPKADAAKEAPKTGPSALQPGDTTRRQAKGEAREAKGEAREGVRESRETAREGRQEAREAGREGREAAREARRDTRAESRENLRAADLGLWFNRRAGVSGLVVADVSAEGAITKAGFKEGDRIVSINDQPVTTEAEFMRFLLAEELLDKQAKVVVMRDNREETIHVQPSALLREMAISDPLWRQGIVIDDRDPNRVVVLKVYPRTPAYYAGLRAGDVITRMRGQRIARIADLVQNLTAANGNVEFEVNRGNRTRALEFNTDDESGELRVTLKPNVDSEQRPAGKAEPRSNQPADQKPRLEKPKNDKPAPAPIAPPAAPRP
jgi:hypothetical protein